MSIIDGSIEYEIRTIPSLNDLSTEEVKNDLDLISKKELGYRQPNTTYNIGDIVYHKDLPTDWYLECITSGSTGNEDIIFNNVIGTIINDGTVKWAINGIMHNAASHNALYRGADLTDYFNSGEMSTAIANGTFQNIYPGDYIIKTVTIDGTEYENIKWIIGDCDYYLNTYGTSTLTHHVLIFPETPIGCAPMNLTNTTEGGYVNSEMWKTTIPKYVIGIKDAFGISHILKHPEALTNSVSLEKLSGSNLYNIGASKSAGTYNVEVNIFSEVMMFGTRVFSSSAYDIADGNTQISAFSHNKKLIFSNGWIWSRSICDWIAFCGAHQNGFPYALAATDNGIVRPYFLLY